MILRNFSIRVGDRQILDSTCMKFQPGAINHLLGANGIGKSTLAKSMAGLIPHSGEVNVDPGEVTLIGSYSGIPKDMRSEDILALAEERAGKQLFKKLVDGLDISNIRPSLKLSKLSDGQRQKLKLIFFLSSAKRIVILDECTSALDRRSADSIRGFLNSYLNQKEITSINITHDISDLKKMPGRNYLFEDARIEGPMTTEQIVESYIGR